MSTAGDAARKKALVEHILSQMAAAGPVQAKAMFGGFGLYHDGGHGSLMFALVADGRLFFKVDELTVGDFTRRGLGPFTYIARGHKVGSLKYHEAPPEVMDEPEHMATWARQAQACAQRAQAAAGAKRSRRAAVAPQPGRAAEATQGGKATKAPVLAQLGPASQAMLAQAGIVDDSTLRRLGAVQAYARTKATCPRASLNLLWALEGALSGRPWREVADTDRASLLMALEDVRHLPSGGD